MYLCLVFQSYPATRAVNTCPVFTTVHWDLTKVLGLYFQIIA